jgi:hypothetical protein
VHACRHTHQSRTAVVVAHVRNLPTLTYITNVQREFVRLNDLRDEDDQLPTDRLTIKRAIVSVLRVREFVRRH